ncbi:hypothetical protein ABI59_12235 [Acidobacteria bacterium Mor1]|nr:hypothetical protein ABI59_12235 [Acidobacteria bacterium Mor1]
MIFKPSEFNDKLEKAVKAFDHDAAATLCDELIEHVRDRDDKYPADKAKTALELLRRQRYFVLMENVADALLQNGQQASKVLRMYAQALLDQGKLTSGISVLEGLAARSAEHGPDADPDENAEARGLLGRAYKDLYTLGANPARSRNRGFIQKALEFYSGVYEEYRNHPVLKKRKVWQGINSVALWQRADDDGLELDGIGDLSLSAQSRAKDILEEVKERRQNKDADTWDHATGLEACVGLGRYESEYYEEALVWLHDYLDSRDTDAFELGSTYRQLTMVWRLTADKAPGDKILPALKARLLDQPGADIRLGSAEARGESYAELLADSGFERVFGRDGFTSVRWLEKAMSCAAGVARIEDVNEESVGTGFLLRAGDLHPEWAGEFLLMTNSHVVSDDESVRQALRPSKARARFDLWAGGSEKALEVEELWTSPPDEFDTTLLRVKGLPDPDEDASAPQPVAVADRLPVGEGQRAYIIGHPQGRKLSFSIHDNHLLDRDDRFLHYRSPTEPGSSGSPVFNREWELIGLHHRGLRKMPRLNGVEGTYKANEGVQIGAIRAGIEADLAKRKAVGEE